MEINKDKYGEGTTLKLIFETFTTLREEYPTSDMGTIIFAKEVIEVLDDFLETSAAKIC